jgi:hypothetical protein
MSEPELISMHVQTTAEAPFAAYKRQQAALARRRLYPLSAFYTLYAILVLAIAFSTKHPWIAVAFFWAGCATWTLVEYLFHRYVLQGRFPPGKGLIRKFLHERFDPLHWDHHARLFNHERGTSNLREELAMTLPDLITNSCRFVAATFFAVLLVPNSQQTSAQDRSMHITRTDSGGSN